MWNEWSTLKKLIWLKMTILKAASFAWETVMGAAPLSLADAVAKPIKSLIQYGRCAQAGTPSQTNRVPILCNNGELKCSPNLLDASATNTVLGYYINKADGVIKDSPYNFYFADFMPVVPGETYVAYGRSKDGSDLSDYNRVAWYDSNKDWISGANYTQNQIAVVTAPAGAAYARFSCNPSGGTTAAVTQDVVDSYNWVFQHGSSEPSEFHRYMEIYVEGTPEVLALCGENLIDYTFCQNRTKNGITTTKNADGSITVTGTSDGGYRYWNTSDTMNLVLPAGTYTLSEHLTLDKGGSKDSGTFTIDAETTYINAIFSGWSNGETVNVTLYPLLTVASTLQTAYVENLLSLPAGRADEQEIVSGVLGRYCRVVVFDGTEDWHFSGGNNMKLYINRFSTSANEPETCAIYCTHSKPAETPTWSGLQPGECIWDKTGQGVDLDFYSELYGIGDWKAALARWRSLGTPMMAVVPMPYEADETAGKSLSTVKGTNTLIVTAEVSAIQCEAVYAKAKQ